MPDSTFFFMAEIHNKKYIYFLTKRAHTHTPTLKYILVVLLYSVFIQKCISGAGHGGEHL